MSRVSSLRFARAGFASEGSTILRRPDDARISARLLSWLDRTVPRIVAIAVFVTVHGVSARALAATGELWRAVPQQAGDSSLERAQAEGGGGVAARAGLADYRLTNADWNGMSEFAELSRDAGVEWVIPESAGPSEDGASGDESVLEDGRGIGSSVASGRGPPFRIIAIIHPTIEDDADELFAWVERGGTLLIADDFGRSESLVSRLGITRVDVATLGRAEDSAAPTGLRELRPARRSPLTRGVFALMTNHPAALAGATGGVLPFDEQHFLVYSVALGRGEVIVLADPSVLINAMLDLDGNRRFARNLLGELCETGHCRGLYVTGEAMGRVNEALARAERQPASKSRDPRNELAEMIAVTVERYASATLSKPARRLLLFVLTMLTAFLLYIGFPQMVRAQASDLGAGGERPFSRLELLERTLSRVRATEKGNAGNQRVVELMRDAFSEQLREVYALQAREFSRLVDAAAPLASDEERSLLRTIEIRFATLSGNDPGPRNSRSRKHRKKRVPIDELRLLIADIERWIEATSDRGQRGGRG